jgi:hypothetical protein
MTFKSKGAIFKNTPEKLQQRLGDRYDASKKYPDVDGVFGIKEEDRMAFASYIMNADANDKGEIPVRITGYNNTSQSGVKYLGVTIEPDYKTIKGIEEKMVAAGAAQSLAKATGGTVVAGEIDEADLF